MICRRRDAVAVLLILGVVLLGVWIAGRHEEGGESAQIGRAEPEGAGAPTLRGSTGALPEPRAGHDVQADRGPETDTGVVGTWSFEGRVVDAGGEPVAGTELTIHDRVEGRVQRVTSDAEGRFHCGGVQGTPVEVDLTPGARPGFRSEFSWVEGRVVHLDRGPVELRLERYPVVHLRGRFEGASPDLFCPPTSVRPEPLDATDALPQRSITGPEVEAGVRLDPGRWRLHVWFAGFSPVTVDTPRLAMDQVEVMEVPVALQDSHALVEVRFDRTGQGDAVSARCALEAMKVPPGSGWHGPRRSARASGMLLTLMPGEWDLVGAVRFGSEVYFSEPARVRVDKGDHTRVRMRTVRAGGIRVPPQPSRFKGQLWFELKECAYPGHGVVEDDPFRMGWVEGRARSSAWWMPPGRYTLRRKDHHQVEFELLQVEVKDGVLLRLTEEEGRLRLPGD